ncbi:hypothetical protein N7495_000529 [Penicillium taxi]|uniref:uncharacterized protein n=1 Tax=Penicillium taxi TaxID=168475 RepID=UPI0025452893|nr:uncharacterized protein N7495_000529 [Penicillium taxi]KAJ5907847.1 hypothetical protein N7495_000529 [Penicillium taxi]
MSLELYPPELGFKRPFTREVCEVLSLRNTNSDPVVFKVKTTAPKQYCVRPNSGRIEPGKQVEVQVLLQSMKDEPAPGAKCKDKFLVQSVKVTGDMSYGNVSSVFDNTPKTSVVERKLRVSWLEADSPGAEIPATHEFVDEEPPTSYSSSPFVNYETPAPGHAKNISANHATPIAKPEFLESVKSEVDEKEDLYKTKAVVDNTPVEEDVEEKLRVANAELKRLHDRLDEYGLRQRKDTSKAATTETKSSPTVIQQGNAESGVPVQIVAGLCLLSFLIAYFFF